MNAEINRNDYLSLEQVQELTGVSEEHLNSFISNGDLETVHINGSLYVPKVDFKVFEKSLEEGRAILYSALDKDYTSLEENTELSQEEIDELKEIR